MSSSKPKPLFTFLLAAVSIVIGLAAIEGMLRVKNSAQDVYDIEMWRYSNELKQPSSNPVLGHEHRVSSSAVLQKTTIRINERGLRGAPITPLTSNQRRILFLGSSITLGWGVTEEDILTARLEQKLRQAGENVQVLNAGIGNYNTVRYVEGFFSKLEDLKPSDIVVHYFLNDAEELKAGGGNFLLRNSELAVTLWTVANRFLGPSGENTLVDHYKRVYEEDAPGYVAMQAALTKLSDYAKKNDVRLIFAMTPDIHNLTNYKFGFIHERMKALAEKLGFTTVDFLDQLKGIEPSSIWAMPGDPHPNSLGHKIMAEALYPLLVNEN